MDNDHSVSQWIASLKTGDADAAQALWDRYANRLVDLAQQRLGRAPRRVADEEDVVLSVFDSVCRGAEAGRFGDVRNRDELWWLLLAITKQKVIDHIRRENAEKRGAGAVHTETASNPTDNGRHYSLDQLIGSQPTPELLMMLDEEHQRLLSLLRDDRLRRIAASRIDGSSIAEISEELGISTRSVERKLKLIRESWQRELFP